jgi:hypothetical protein
MRLLEQSRRAVHEAGAWGLFVDGKRLDRDFPKTCRWLTVLINQVRMSFPWASVGEAEVGLQSGAIDWRREEVDFDEWLAKNVRPDDICGGLTAGLDLELFWIGFDGERGESILPEAGRLLVDPSPLSRSNTPEIYCSFLVKVNLFTDVLWSASASTHINIADAAQRNRQRLTRSLREWESISGGEIREWESRLISGIERYGFPDNCAEV